MVINFYCKNCGKHFSIVSPQLPFRGTLHCHFCGSTDVKRIYHKDIGEVKK